MTDSADDELALLAARDPAALPLARLAALAARVEPELLRALRLALVPAATAGTEAELWFSEIVSARGARAITFDPAAVARLRADVLAEGRDRLARGVRIVRRLHRRAPALVHLEERLIVWALLDRATPIDAALARVVTTMLDEPARAEDLAAWAQRALPRLPPAAQRADAYWSLLFAANARLPATSFEPPAGAAAVAAAVPAIFAGVPDVHVAVERRGDAVRLRLVDAPGPTTIPAPAIRPIVLAIASGGGPAQVRIAARDRWTDDVPVTGPTVHLRVADGREHVATTVTVPAAATAAAEVDAPTRAARTALARLLGERAHQLTVAPACARIQIGAQWQSGYLIGDRLVATTSIPSSDDFEPPAAVVHLGDATYAVEAFHTVLELHVAVLRLVTPVPGVTPLALDPAPVDIDAAWSVTGFTGPSAWRLTHLAGVGLHEHPERGFFLPVEDLARTPTAGLAGAPVVVSGRVVAHVWGTSELGLLVTRVAHVIRAMPMVDPPAQRPAQPPVEIDSPRDRLAALHAPTSRSIFDEAAHSVVVETVQAPGARVVQITGGTAEQRSGLARRFADGFADDVIDARTFERGAPLPEEVVARSERPAFIVLDGADRLDEAGRSWLESRAASTLAQWILTSEKRLNVTAPETPHVHDGRVVDAGALPRDRALRTLLQAFAPRRGVYEQPSLRPLAAWGADVLVQMAVAALEVVIEGDRGEQLDVTHRLVVQAARAWLQCPCEHHARITTPTNAPITEALVRLVAHAQDGEVDQVVFRAAQVIAEAMALAGDPRRVGPAMILAVLGGDETRHHEALLAGRISASLELRGERPFVAPLDRDVDRLRDLSGDPALELFHADRNAGYGKHPRVLVETTRDAYPKLVAAYRQRRLERVAELPILWIAESRPTPDLEDPNRGQFGGLPDRGRLSVRARVTQVDAHDYRVEVRVEVEELPAGHAYSEAVSIDVFDADGRVERRPFGRGGTATFALSTWRSFTVGVEHEGERVELDLAAGQDLPEDFARPPHALSAIPLEPGTTWRYRGGRSADAGADETRMVVVDAHVLDPARPTIVALIDGHLLPRSDGPWTLVRHGSMYFQLAGGRDRFARLRDGRDPLMPSLTYERLLFRFPIASGAPLVPGVAPPDQAWRCEAVHRGDDGARAYQFARPNLGRGPTRLTVVAGLGITDYDDPAAAISARLVASDATA